MIIKIREKMHYNIKIEAAKVSALSSDEIDKYEYLTGEEIFPSNNRQIIEQATFAYSSLGKAFEKQTKNQVSAIKSLKHSNKKDKSKQIEGILPLNVMNDLIHDKLKEIVNLPNIII